MAVPANTIQNVGLSRVREDLYDKIGEVYADDTPFQRAIGRSKINNTYTEWETDSLAAADHDNKAIQGDDLANDARADTVRVGNHTQIFTKVIGVSTTAEWTDKAGERSELSKQLMKAIRELRTDVEKRALGNYASVAATSAVAGEMAGALAWLTTNTSLGATGANGGFSAGIVSAATNGTQRAYTETLLKDVLQQIWTSGGNPKMVFTNGAQKQAEAAFAGLADRRTMVSTSGQSTIVAGADVYISDFGSIQFVPDRFASSRDALIIDPEYWDLGIGEGMTVNDMGVTGLAKRKYIRTELTLRSLNEKASGAVRDLS